MTRFTDITPLADAEPYLAEAVRLAGAVPEGARNPALIRRVGVLGAGTMGRGIAMAFAQAGRDVVLVDASEDALKAASDHVAALAERSLIKGRIDAAGRDALVRRIATGTDFADFAGADLVIEAVPEIMPLKQDVLCSIEAVVGTDCLITSNTSTLDVDALAAALANPGRFLGTHFFLPAQVNPLLELVPADRTAPETVAAVLALAGALRKQAVIAPNGDGFIGNRLFDRFHQEAMYLVEEGADPKDVDSVLEEWGFAIGPFRTLDMIGNDVPWIVRRERAGRADPPPQPRIGDALCEEGLLGQKTGRGWFLYDEATPKGRPYEEAQALALKVSRSLGLKRRRIAPEEILGRCLTALMVEGMAMLNEGRARRASDVDMVYVTGYGFPRHFGGPMRLCEALGWEWVLKQAHGFAETNARTRAAWYLARDLSRKEAVA